MLLVEMHFAPQDVTGAVRTITSVVGLTQVKPGCRACSVSLDASDGGWVRYSETWNTEGAFRRHVQSEDFRPVLVAMDMCSEEPTVLVGNLSGQTGLTCLLGRREPPGNRAACDDRHG